MKVAIVTFTHVNNYGNRLQNYALQEALKSRGLITQTLYNTVDSCWKEQAIKKLKKRIKRLFKYKRSLSEKREDSFQRFNDKYIDFSNYVVYKENADESIGMKYDAFIAGSDQIWNPHYVKSQFYLLDFVRDSSKKYSYAASFGVESFEKIEDKSVYTSLLSEFNKISVRESAGAYIVQELLGYKPPVVLDPTMLIERQKWLDLAADSKLKESDEYILVYYLGEIPENVLQYIEKRKNHIKIIYLENELEKNIVCPEYFDCSPVDFLYLINNANLILTDSFHACVFSIIFNKRFFVTDRKTQEQNNLIGSRITELMSITGISGVYNAPNINESFSIDYNDVNHRLIELRKKSNAYIDSIVEQLT